jgi:hypothetical protein
MLVSFELKWFELICHVEILLRNECMHTGIFLFYQVRLRAQYEAKQKQRHMADGLTWLVQELMVHDPDQRVRAAASDALLVIDPS